MLTEPVDDNEVTGEDQEACARKGEQRQPIPFGLKEGRLYEPRQVPIGKNCGCVCPGCGERLVAKHCLSGKISPHFAHYANAECATGLETALHLAAKQVIADAKQVYLPELVVQVAGYTSLGRDYDVSEVLVQAGPCSFDQVHLEAPMADIKPDVIGMLRSRKLLIEIAVTHFVDTEKLRRIRDLDLACVEFNLAKLGRDTTLADLERILLQGELPGKWTHHPKQAETRARLQARVQGLIDAHEQIAARRKASEEARRRQAQLEKQRAADRKNQQRLAYQQLSPRDKLRYSLRLLGLQEEAPPSFLNLPVWQEGAFGVHRAVWQAALFGAFVHKRLADTPTVMFAPEVPRDWLFQQLGLQRAPCENSLKAVTNYLFKLTDLGITARHYRQFEGRRLTLDAIAARLQAAPRPTARAMPPAEVICDQVEPFLARLEISTEVVPWFVDIPVNYEGCFNASRPVWQAALFERFVHRRALNTPPQVFYVDEACGWLKQQFGARTESWAQPYGATLAYLHALAENGLCLENSGAFTARYLSASDILKGLRLLPD